VIAAPEPIARGIARSSDDVEIAWSRYGSGDRAILFVPTWNLVDSRVVGHQVAAFSPHATVLTYDPRGAGASERPARGYTFAAHAADVVAVMDACGLERAAVVTASRGLNAAVLVAAAHPERVERIAVIGPYMQLTPEEPPDPAGLEALRTDWRGFIDPFMRAVFSEPDSEEVIAEMIGIGMEASAAVVATQEIELEWTEPALLMGQVTCPVLVIHGEDDGPVPLSHAEEIVAALPTARLEVIPRGGHRPDIRSPELVNPPLLDFLLGSGAR
jgi:pimeloyl-ACP methyl ester carboxylesterase